MTTVLPPEELARRIEGRASADETAEGLADPKLAERYSFEIDYTDGRKRRFRGSFTNQILNFHQRAQRGSLRAQLIGGVPIESVDLETLDMVRKIAHMQFSLVIKPDWCDLGTMKDDQLLDAIWQEVLGHEDTFRGSRQVAPAGAGASADV